MRVALAIALALGAAPRPAPAPALAPRPARPPPAIEATYLFQLVTPTGVLPLHWPSLTYDRTHDELFVVAEGFVRVFDATGMEVHSFGDDGSLGRVERVAVLEDGELLLLTNVDGKRALLRCDFRGEPIAPLELAELPASLGDFQPDQMVYRDGRLYFAERGSMRVVVTDGTGRYLRASNLREVVTAVLPPDGDRRPPTHLDAFNVDDAGNLLVTMATTFAAAVVSPDGEVRLFGMRGSRPGTFNIVGGIDANENGLLFVTDRLRSSVSVWSRDLQHLGAFGYRGEDVSNLSTPYEIAVGNGKVFVAQAGGQGVKVFRIQVVDPAPQPAPQPPPQQAAPPAAPPRRPPPTPSRRGVG